MTRAKQKIQEAHVPFEIPVGDELARRLESVLQSLYLLFNEGYKASSGDKLVREELCREASALRNCWHNIALEISQRRMRCWR